MRQPGIHNITDEEYFADPAINNSGLKAVVRSPAHYQYQLRNPKEQTPAMLAGSAMHCAILEPAEFSRRYAVIPADAPAKPTSAMINAKNPSESSIDRVTYWESFEIASMGKDIITEAVSKDCFRISDAVRTHPELSAIFENGKAEQAIFAEDPVTGVMCKCKPDYLTQVSEYRIQVELKSADDARVGPFTRSVMNYGYFQGSAFYHDMMDWAGLDAPDLYLMVVIEREEPYGIKVYEVPEDCMDYGRRQYRQALDLYKHCLDMDEWPNYSTDIEVLQLPAWARFEANTSV